MNYFCIFIKGDKQLLLFFFQRNRFLLGRTFYTFYSFLFLNLVIKKTFRMNSEGFLFNVMKSIC
jgi:hypothetical protein